MDQVCVPRISFSLRGLHGDGRVPRSLFMRSTLQDGDITETDYRSFSEESDGSGDAERLVARVAEAMGRLIAERMLVDRSLVRFVKRVLRGQTRPGEARFIGAFLFDPAADHGDSDVHEAAR